MSRIETACYGLIASAFILAGLLVFAMHDRLVQPAEAGQVLTRDNLTVMTAQTRANEEALFVLDNVSQRLLVYRLDVPRNRVELAGGANLAEVFARLPGGGGGGGAGGGR